MVFLTLMMASEQHEKKEFIEHALPDFGILNVQIESVQLPVLIYTRHGFTGKKQTQL